MIYVTWPPGCYGHYVMQSIYAYSNLSMDSTIKLELTGSSHGFKARTHFIFDHELSEQADVIISPNKNNQLDYMNNQLMKAENGNIVQSVAKSFPNWRESLYTNWNNDSTWSLREWISFWLVDNMKQAYKTINGTLSTLDLFNKNVFPEIINRLGLTVTVDDATMKVNQQQWIAQQRYHNSQHRCNAWVEDILNDRNTSTPCQTILDEAYVQHCLREQGYEIRCDGLDIFPTNSNDLRELIYENRNTDNK